MRRQHKIMSLLLGLSLAAPVATAANAQSNVFDGNYSGTMQLSSGGFTDASADEPCENSRPANMVISRGYVVITYLDWHRHLIHYKGRVAADGTVTAYHRNRTGTATNLSGSVSSDQFNAETMRGHCQYSFAMSKT